MALALVTPSVRDGSPFGWHCQWRGGTNRPSVTTHIVRFSAPPRSENPKEVADSLKGYLTGVVSASSLVSTTKTASRFAGWVLLALRLIEWLAFGGSDQLSPAR